MLVYVVLVSVIFQRPEEDYPLFIFAAILPWKWFTSSVNDAIGSIASQDRLIKQVHFPKIVLPTATVVAGILHFAFGLVPLAALLVLVYSDRLSLNLVYLPVIAAVQFVFTLAFGYAVAAINVFYRDIANISRHALRLWFYLSPALYGAATLERIASSRSHPHPALPAQPVLRPLHVVPQRDLRHGDGRPAGAGLARPPGPQRRLAGLPRPRHRLLQAGRAGVREGAVMAGRVPGAPPPYAIDVRDLGVQYDLRLTRKNTLQTTFRQLFKRRRDGDRTFWALKGVSFRLVHGESLAVIGPNGAGKSTLLQVLAGIITPSEGGIDVVGHVSSLLTLGAGFDQDLTGRDNILLAGAFLGIEDAEMRRRMDAIIDFADIGQFIDAPIKTYSSGMRARLGFSIATSVDPDVLLLDEVLATGDQVFRAKSKARVLEIAAAAKAVVLVTHDMNWVTEFCNRALLIEQGRVVAEGDPGDVVAIHQEHSERSRAEKAAEAARILAGASA